MLCGAPQKEPFRSTTMVEATGYLDHATNTVKRRYTVNNLITYAKLANTSSSKWECKHAKACVHTAPLHLAG